MVVIFRGNGACQGERSFIAMPTHQLERHPAHLRATLEFLIEHQPNRIS